MSNIFNFNNYWHQNISHKFFFCKIERGVNFFSFYAYFDHFFKIQIFQKNMYKSFTTNFCIFSQRYKAHMYQVFYLYDHWKYYLHTHFWTQSNGRSYHRWSVLLWITVLSIYIDHYSKIFDQKIYLSIYWLLLFDKNISISTYWLL